MWFLDGWDGWTGILYAEPYMPTRRRGCARGQHCRPALRAYPSRIASRGGSGKEDEQRFPSAAPQRQRRPLAGQSLLPSGSQTATSHWAAADGAISGPVPLLRRNVIEYIHTRASTIPLDRKIHAMRCHVVDASIRCVRRHTAGSTERVWYSSHLVFGVGADPPRRRPQDDHPKYSETASRPG